MTKGSSDFVKLENDIKLDAGRDNIAGGREDGSLLGQLLQEFCEPWIRRPAIESPGDKK